MCSGSNTVNAYTTTLPPSIEQHVYCPCVIFFYTLFYKRLLFTSSIVIRPGYIIRLIYATTSVRARASRAKDQLL